MKLVLGKARNLILESIELPNLWLPLRRYNLEPTLFELIGVQNLPTEGRILPLVKALSNAAFDDRDLFDIVNLQILKLAFGVFQPQQKILGVHPKQVQEVWIGLMLLDQIPDIHVLEPDTRLQGIWQTAGVFLKLLKIF